jgi:hypothetical protein
MDLTEMKNITFKIKNTQSVIVSGLDSKEKKINEIKDTE